ncbi:hypothetical protein [Streptomyces antimycoticus]|uniref:hypothetical protein n=1 Tax=Streptomyces antimycoticus TaxID=68175 RepID=UPI00280BB66E|nr:hypothetical protein [Streptomyces antimycoticus]
MRPRSRDIAARTVTVRVGSPNRSSASCAAVRPSGCAASSSSTSAWRALSSCVQAPDGPEKVRVQRCGWRTSSSRSPQPAGPPSSALPPSSTRSRWPPGSGSTAHAPSAGSQTGPSYGAFGSNSRRSRGVTPVTPAIQPW